tara:strand:+ start:467 stop:598 length:132 start_codon:yes stop_codon:yes gene_type:complete
MRELLENDADVRGRSANEAHEDSYEKLVHVIQARKVQIENMCD